MYAPWFCSTDEATRLAFKASEDDYLRFLENTLGPDTIKPAIVWHVAVLIFFADLLISSGTKIKQGAMPHLSTTFRTR
ncbi:MAG: hypothetical protein CVU44_19095 [Chloroflexi bacterium HGW-Chloroflexi-6]|nr:MAG: hypothetical protein CVU44_19095 [Chloroflexi bacterium HGW-Chloroflexi-6]